MEVVNVAPEVMAQLYKFRSISLCANTVGQFLVELMTNPPVEGEPSYPQYAAETSAIFDSLKRRAARLTSALNALPGISVARSPGAMYAFPQFTLPAAALDAAADAGMVPDVYYAMRLINSTGIVVVPGSGFKAEGETAAPFHFRTTFPPQEDAIEKVIERFSDFPLAFIDEFGGHEDL